MKYGVIVRTIPCNLFLVECTVSPSYATCSLFSAVDSLPVAVQDEDLVRSRGTASNAGLSEHSAVTL